MKKLRDQPQQKAATDRQDEAKLIKINYR